MFLRIDRIIRATAFSRFEEENHLSISRQASRHRPVKPREIFLLRLTRSLSDHPGAIVAAREQHVPIFSHIEDRQFSGNTRQ